MRFVNVVNQKLLDTVTSNEVRSIGDKETSNDNTSRHSSSK